MPVPAQPIRLYRFGLSGHSHRVELFLSLLDLPFEMIDVDLPGGAHKTPDFLVRSPFGQVPAIEDGEVVLADSNAILVYLAGRYDEAGRWLPRDPLAAAEVQRWLSVAAGFLAYGPGAARLVTVFKAQLDHERAKALAARLYGVMEAHLARGGFLAGSQPTIADIANYTYTAVAPEGGVSLQPYPNIRAWLERIEALPGFVPMQRTAIAA
ncbi:glutathione S-transferase family protein [Inquilinus sp.]|jgi:glutathione S-transferase|uniref:glutathione S-transferase family protein n=1 Tax=Inquilinus sp. TaxID=1932117 RepID=UPI0037848258